MDTRAIEKQLSSVRWCSPVENIPPRPLALSGHKETGAPLFLVSHMLLDLEIWPLVSIWPSPARLPGDK